MMTHNQATVAPIHGIPKSRNSLSGVKTSTNLSRDEAKDPLTADLADNKQNRISVTLPLRGNPYFVYRDDMQSKNAGQTSRIIHQISIRIEAAVAMEPNADSRQINALRTD